jgi:hypothetical protein
MMNARLYYCAIALQESSATMKGANSMVLHIAHSPWKYFYLESPTEPISPDSWERNQSNHVLEHFRFQCG